MAEKNAKRLVTIELEDEVKNLSITGMNSDEQVLMSRELGEDLLDQVAGGQSGGRNNLPPKEKN